MSSQAMLHDDSVNSFFVEIRFIHFVGLSCALACKQDLTENLSESDTHRSEQLFDISCGCNFVNRLYF